jgi:SNF2 family DNA or RNA helicase
MGLGKTVQTLALIARVAEQGSRRFLVVAPTSVVTNWVAECHKFTPGLTAVAVTSTEARSGTSLAEQSAAADIVVTSYALLRIDFEAYAGIDWAGIILDEAQFVKNHTSKTHQCARRLEAPFKLAITGTPMENNLMELWSLLSITAPGLFPSPKAFTNHFLKPIESGTNKERLSVLRRRIKPVMLRRTKGQVAGELPPKQEQVLLLDLGAKHRRIYDTRMARERQKVLGLLGEWEKNRFQIFRSLTLLRQLSLHAGLVDQSKADVGAAKVDFLVEQLPELVAEGHSALVFSQFTGFLDVLRSQLDAVGVSYSYLDGSSSSRQRDAAIGSFKAGTNQVFLISLKAGGFGLNLTEADYCFVCDPWWNPAAEAQAVDRTHRIGQTRPVTVYRLVSEGTIEEKVVALQARKRDLFTAVVDEGDVFGSAVTASDVRELFG